jgi:hypothetical protein
MRVLVVLLVLVGFVAAGQTQEEGCPELAARLVAGEWARVTFDNAVNVRPMPSTQRARLDVVGMGMMGKVIDGAVCAEGYRWWQIDFENGLSGWVAEGSDRATENGEPNYWLEPRGLIEIMEDEDGVERAYVVDEEGNIIERADCMRPPDDYRQVQWGFATFNRRTAVMLQHADRLYRASGGSVRLQDRVVQGSYNIGVAASFGTHDGGGAVDISVRSPKDFSVMTDEIPLMIDALRTAGFAAWLRRPDELYPGSPIHIHAIAVGDEDHSEAARGQIDGKFGYLRGYNGLPQEDDNPPIADMDGEPVICQWMVETGFEDLREED